MDWLVLIHKTTGELSVTTRELREKSLVDYKNFRLQVPTRVDKTFDTEKEATAYLKRVNGGTKILKKCNYSI